MSMMDTDLKVSSEQSCIWRRPDLTWAASARALKAMSSRFACLVEASAWRRLSCSANLARLCDTLRTYPHTGVFQSACRM